MADPIAPAAPPSPAEVAANLTAARGVSGMAFRAEATRLQNAGAQLPYADGSFWRA